METKICIVGLGYVGLPLAVEFGKKINVIGFDINENRINALKQGNDNTNEVADEDLKQAKIEFTNNPEKIKQANFIIIAVPTPITDDKKPDLSYVKSASEIVGKNLSKNSIVVYESTVYPGVTEEICLPILEKHSNLKHGEFNIGYSPERINPGDKEHTVDKIIKIIAGDNEKTTEKIAEVYSKIITAGLHIAPNIKTAEAAKIIENVQRDLNIALMNELSLIFEKIGINTKDVIEAAGSKWNFHKYHPGLVGGHCIGIDPYYLTFKAQQLGYNPKMILAGREINDYMPEHVAEITINELKKAGKELKQCKVLLLGLTFKENVPDIRNSKAKDVVEYLKKQGINVIAYEPLIEKGIVKEHFGIENIDFNNINKVDAVILINAHEQFKQITLENLKQIMDKPILIDIKNFYNKEKAKELGFDYTTL